MTAISWNGVNGDWGLATDWSTGTVPTSADDVAFSASGSYLVTIGGADAANSLTFDASQAALFEDGGSLTISGALAVDSGFVSLNSANMIGSVSVGAATLAIGNSGALGTGVVTVNGGELLGTANATFANALDLSGNVTMAAANGTTLNENASSYQFAANMTLNFGARGEGGTILWHTGVGSAVPPLGDINIQAGTLVGADSGFSSIFSNSPQTTVAAGATLDLGGFNATVNDLVGGGSITDSGAAATLTLGAANLSGAVGGSLSLVFDGDASLSGAETLTGGATLNGPVTVTNTGTYDIVANTNLSGAPPSQFINSGLFEKTGGGGVSDVTTNFVNNGALDVLSGSVVFSGGFTNNGVIHGIVRESGGITAIGAAVPSDFTGDGLADILWRGANGDVELWDSKGSGGFAGKDLGIVPTSYQIAGTADFNGDGLADILWRNSANGDVEIWNSNGSGGFAGKDLGIVPTSYQIAGTGDFTGDGLADILWRGAGGDVVLWNSKGSGGFAGKDLGIVPTSYQIAGTGDFTGNGEDSVLWRNSANGDVQIWNPNGSGGFSGKDLGIVPTSYQIVGTGDFNGDGRTDILWRGANGDVEIWSSNGSGGFSGKDLGIVPTSYQIAATGDFDGSGRDGILWRNSVSGDVQIWNPNGSGGFAAHDLGAVATTVKIAPAWG
jgi:hypothetical protein